MTSDCKVAQPNTDPLVHIYQPTKFQLIQRGLTSRPPPSATVRYIGTWKRVAVFMWLGKHNKQHSEWGFGHSILIGLTSNFVGDLLLSNSSCPICLLGAPKGSQGWIRSHESEVIAMLQETLRQVGCMGFEGRCSKGNPMYHDKVVNQDWRKQMYHTKQAQYNYKVPVGPIQHNPVWLFHPGNRFNLPLWASGLILLLWFLDMSEIWVNSRCKVGMYHTL
jgi:hypothetical protein